MTAGSNSMAFINYYTDKVIKGMASWSFCYEEFSACPSHACWVCFYIITIALIQLINLIKYWSLDVKHTILSPANSLKGDWYWVLWCLC